MRVRLAARGLFVLVALGALGACGHDGRPDAVVVSPGTARPASANADGASPDVATSTTTGGVPAGFRGIFHLPGHVDSINLVLEDDGTFRWRIFGCDFGGGAAGVWHASPVAVVLAPTGSAQTFAWMDDTSFTHAARNVTLHAGPGGALEATASGGNGTETWAQTWQPGRVCAQCGGGLGPDKMPRACDKPLAPDGTFGD